MEEVVRHYSPASSGVWARLMSSTRRALKDTSERDEVRASHFRRTLCKTGPHHPRRGKTKFRAVFFHYCYYCYYFYSRLRWKEDVSEAFGSELDLVSEKGGVVDMSSAPFVQNALNTFIRNASPTPSAHRPPVLSHSACS